MRGKRLFCVALAVLLLGGSAARAVTLNPQQARDLFLLNMELNKEFQAKDYAKASETCRKIVNIVPEQPVPRYTLARILARLGKADEAISALQEAVQRGLKGVGQIQKEEDLAGLHEDKRFAECIHKVNENERSGGAYEAGSAIEGVKTLEADPEAGFRFRLRMSPTATLKKPNRLILWLHPAGGSENQKIEPLSRRLNALGYALLVITQKDWHGWVPIDLPRLLDGTVPEAAKTPGIDAERPILMGLGMPAGPGPGSGGQAALAMWQSTPGKFGGIVLDAAYPVRPKAGGGFETIPLPENIGIQQTPFFVIVGENDKGAGIWREAEPSWRQQGIPLTVTYVAGKDQGWLFGDKELDSLCAWLKQVHAGKLPSGSPAAETPPKKETKKR